MQERSRKQWSQSREEDRKTPIAKERLFRLFANQQCANKCILKPVATPTLDRNESSRGIHPNGLSRLLSVARSHHSVRGLSGPLGALLSKGSNRRRGVVLRLVRRCLDEECPVYGLCVVLIAHLLWDLLSAPFFLRCHSLDHKDRKRQNIPSPTQLSGVVSNVVHYLWDSREHNTGANPGCLFHEPRNDDTTEMRHHC